MVSSTMRDMMAPQHVAILAIGLVYGVRGSRPFLEVNFGSGADPIIRRLYMHERSQIRVSDF
jgi:hypothetical protein